MARGEDCTGRGVVGAAVRGVGGKTTSTDLTPSVEVAFPWPEVLIPVWHLGEQKFQTLSQIFLVKYNENYFRK